MADRSDAYTMGVPKNAMEVAPLEGGGKDAPSRHVPMQQFRQSPGCDPEP
jgi:hypothetical protein